MDDFSTVKFIEAYGSPRKLLKKPGKGAVDGGASDPSVLCWGEGPGYKHTTLNSTTQRSRGATVLIHIYLLISPGVKCCPGSLINTSPSCGAD